MRAIPSTILIATSLLVGSLSAQQPKLSPQPARPTVGQHLVDTFVRSHPEVVALELALISAQGCKTIAATAREDVGEKCDADELGPIRTGKPDVEVPSKQDPVYDITQALHDAAGRLIGAVGMDLQPEIGDSNAALARARALLGRLEGQIPSKARLLEAMES